MESKDHIQRPYKGLVTDSIPFDQPQETYPYALNAVSETIDGKNNFLSMEHAIEKCASLPSGTTPVGKCYMNDDNVIVFLIGNNKSYIGIINKYHEYIPYVETNQLGFSQNYPINAKFRLRRNSSRVVYWVDGLNVPRTFNFERKEDFYSVEYKDYLTNLPTGSTDNFAGEKWKDLHFDLIKTYEKIPEFANAEILEGGSIPSGSYSIAVQLIDANLNPTEWITTSNPVNIYVDSISKDYSTVRGSRNVRNNVQNFANTAKSIKWTLANLDPNFSYYRIAVLAANQMDGNVNQALVSELRSIDNTTFLYNGSVNGFTETPITDILISKLDIASARYIEQLENRLMIASIKGTDIDWCSFQQYASQIKSELVTKNIKTEDISAKGNPKNPVSVFDTVGYMWDEVYSYGIIYELDNGVESPSFHLPGRPAGVNNGMDFYECSDGSTYLRNDVACLGNDFWGQDGWGNSLTGEPIRHHKFPKKPTGQKRADKLNQICGIRFSNIYKPHPRVTGFKIVRNERTYDDKTVVDNVLIGPLVTENNVPENNYHAFGLLFPNVDATKRSVKGAYIFSPEHQFNHDPLLFDQIDVIGTYDEDYKFVPTYRDDNKGSGAYQQDVSPGTSYNEEYHTTEDADGFDLQVMYRSNDTEYVQQSISLPSIKEKYNLSASGSAITDTEIFYNASTDNKIIIAAFENNLPIDTFESGGKKRILYATLKKNLTNAYSDFALRSYYKEHNNSIPFTSDNAHQSPEIYNGDCYTNPMTIVSTVYVDTVFADRKTKTRVWKIILGAALILAAIAVNVIPIGGQLLSATLSATAATVLTTATVMAISYGISVISSGITFEVMKKMIDEHYEAGLKYCVQDGDNWITKTEDGTMDVSNGANYGTFLPPTANDDDTFLWFADRLDNIYFDSSVNIGLRVGLTIGLTDFINSPSPRLTAYRLDSLGEQNPLLGTITSEYFESYLINKLTVVDREQGGGRLYIGFPTSEIYDMNPDFLRKNKEKVYHVLPFEYDCCAENREDFKNRIHYSEQSYQEEVIDNYRVFLPNNYRDIESSSGEITNIFRYNNSLFIHTSEALFHLPQNLQERINAELVTFIGTGEFFSIPPRKISDGATSVAGSRHHQATIVTPHGVFFVSESEKKPYLYTEGASNIAVGNTAYFKNNLKSYLHIAIKDNAGIQYVDGYDNVFSQYMIGLHAAYDERFERILLTKVDYKPLRPFKLYTGSNPLASFVFDSQTKKFGVIGQQGKFNQIDFTNTEYFENKSFTMSFSLKNKSWVSWHSYIPRMYIGTPNNLYSFVERDNSVYLHNNEKSFCKFYGKTYPFIVELNSVSNPVQTRIWNHLALNAMVNRYSIQHNQLVPDNNHFFEIMTLYNERQLSGAIHLKVKSAKPNPEDWFMQQIENHNHEAIVNKVEDTWYINDFRDFVTDINEPLFSKEWIDIKNQFPIDKVINQMAVDFNKDWTQLESFRGKYLTIRLAYYGVDSDNDIQLTINYVIDNEQPSLR